MHFYCHDGLPIESSKAILKGQVENSVIMQRVKHGVAKAFLKPRLH